MTSFKSLTVRESRYSTIYYSSLWRFLRIFANHDDAAGALLPRHPPEVGHGGLGGTLGHDVRLGLHQALQEEGHLWCLTNLSISTHVDIRGVDVVRVGNVGLGLQNNSIEII